MDVLDALKKDWQKQEATLPKLSYEKIYSMLLKKSSSIVKWIFIISIGEILLWTAISFLLLPESNKEFYNEMNLNVAMLVGNIINYAVVAVFIVVFYKNYTAISTTSTIKELMRNILKTRKTVHYFVYYNIGFAALGLIVVNLYLFFNKEKLITYLSSLKEITPANGEEVANAFFLAEFIIGSIFIGFLMLFYYLIYGILLRRLKRNYTELKKIEM